MADDATNSPHLTDTGTASLPTSRAAAEQVAIPQKIRSGVVDPVTGKDCTSAPSSPLSADDERRLARIRKDRANRFMVAVTDVDFLLEILERLMP